LSSVVVGVDLGATHVRVARVSAGGKTGRIRRADVGADPTPEATADLVARLVAEAAGKAEVRAVGVGVAAWIRKDTGMVAVSPNMGWKDVPFGALLSARIAAPIRIVNDLKAIAWGEFRFGAARGSESMIAAYLGSGIGSGAVVHGTLIEGSVGYAGEIGHLRVGRHRYPCGCGARGCVEAVAGGHNLAAILAAEARQGNAPRILELAGGDPSSIHAGHGDQAAREGDVHASALWDEVADTLARALGAVVSLFNPDLLVMGGSVWHGCPELRRRTVPLVTEHSVAPAAAIVRFVDGQLGDLGGLVGAADLARRELRAKPSSARAAARDPSPTPGSASHPPR
jgi:glucokinase